VRRAPTTVKDDSLLNPRFLIPFAMLAILWPFSVRPQEAGPAAYLTYIGAQSSRLFGKPVAAQPPRRMQLDVQFKF